jgi:holo-[acyl-carrier protein] synthase
VTPRLRVGTDMVAVAEVAASIDRFGDRYLDRVLSWRERAQCGDAPHRVAARFAGKEAVVKLLRPGSDESVLPHDVEVLALPSGAPVVRLHGAARDRSTREGLGPVSLSLTHDGGFAAATAITTVTRGKEHQNMSTIVREVLARHAKLTTPVDQVLDGDDLYQLGLTSHATITVMLGIEEACDVEFPDEALTRSTFATIASISAVVDAQLVHA